MEFESKLVPIMREGVDIIKMELFRQLKALLSIKYNNREASYIGKLSGAVINKLFATPNNEKSFAEFTKENRTQIKEEIKNISIGLKELRIPLTDAMRVHVICDYQDGIDSSSILVQAQELGILIVKREIPLPKNFLNMVRKLGKSSSLLVS